MSDAYRFREERIRRRKGGELAAYFWNAKNPRPSSPLCVIVHGMAEYGARYTRLVERMADTGWSFASFDHAGHGRSDGARMRLRSIDDSLDDLEQVLRFIDGVRTPFPMVLFGHSFGGLVATLFAVERRRPLNGLVLSVPAFGLHNLFPCMPLVIRILYRLYPNGIIPKPIRPDRLTHDPLIQREYVTDDRIYKFTGIDFLYNMLKGISRLPRGSVHIGCPILLLLAGSEWVVDNHKSEDLFDRFDSPDKTKIIYPGFFHELFNEIEREKPIADVKGFFRKLETQF